MKCLTVRNPWAALEIMNVKTIENRTWRTSYRGPLLIHSAAKPEDVVYDPPIKMSAEQSSLLAHAEHGHIIGVVDLVEIYNMEDYEQEISLTEKVGEEAFNAFAGDQFCWLFQNGRFLKSPIPYKGRLNLYDVPDELVKDVLP